MDSKLIKDWVFVIIELEIIKIGGDNFKVGNEYPLPDLFEVMVLKHNVVIVKCMDNNAVDIPL